MSIIDSSDLDELRDKAARCDELVAEIDRLKEGAREYACTATDHPCGCYSQFLSEKAEIERLIRERDEWKDKWMALARAAPIVGGPVQQARKDDATVIQQARIMRELRIENERLKEIEAAAQKWRDSLASDGWTEEDIQSGMCRDGMADLMRLLSR